jgi:hypothetical protein
MSNTKQLLPSQIGCIDKEWLEKEVESIVLRQKCNIGLTAFEQGIMYLHYKLKSQLFYIEPIIDEALQHGLEIPFNNRYIKEYLTQPITIKI